jgi:hypothetical protein
MSFVVGEAYTRDQIHAVLGGEAVTYLPQKDGKGNWGNWCQSRF